MLAQVKAARRAVLNMVSFWPGESGGEPLSTLQRRVNAAVGAGCTAAAIKKALSAVELDQAAVLKRWAAPVRMEKAEAAGQQVAAVDDSGQCLLVDWGKLKKRLAAGDKPEDLGADTLSTHQMVRPEVKEQVERFLGGLVEGRNGRHYYITQAFSCGEHLRVAGRNFYVSRFPQSMEAISEEVYRVAGSHGEHWAREFFNCRRHETGVYFDDLFGPLQRYLELASPSVRVDRIYEHLRKIDEVVDVFQAVQGGSLSLMRRPGGRSQHHVNGRFSDRAGRVTNGKGKPIEKDVQPHILFVDETGRALVNAAARTAGAAHTNRLADLHTTHVDQLRTQQERTPDAGGVEQAAQAEECPVAGPGG